MKIQRTNISRHSQTYTHYIYIASFLLLYVNYAYEKNLNSILKFTNF